MDPSGAPLTTGQQAALGAFATLLGGGLAGLAGQNAIGGATAGQNEALNNSGQHLGQGGLIDSIVSWAQNTYGDPVGSVQNWISQFTGQMQSGAQATASQSPSALVAQSVANGVNAVMGSGGGLPPAAGADAVLVNSGAGQAAAPVTGSTPSNAILSSNGNDESTSTPSQGANSGGGGANQEPATNTAAGADNAANGAQLNNQLAAEEIANGHAFDKHVIDQNEFGDTITTQQQFATQIENILNNPSATKQLSNGRSAYWDDTSGMVVIRNPNAADGGTAFKPTNGKAYFNGLR
jgi:filamentous hemagglutinin